MDKKTIIELLKKLENNNSSCSQDDQFIQEVLHALGFSNAVVTSGIVYLEGHGTLEAQPTSINQIAKMLLIALTKAS